MRRDFTDGQEGQASVLFSPTSIRGVCVIDVESATDERGAFARTWCRREFVEHGLAGELVQCATSFNHRAGTLRGLHYQAEPHADAKLVRCTQGAVHDVVVDLRVNSPTLHDYFSIELTAANRRMLYVPPGCAHGYLTLADGCEVFYQMSAAYHPTAQLGVRWDDPAVGIRWPLARPAVISERDASLALLQFDESARGESGRARRDREVRV